MRRRRPVLLGLLLAVAGGLGAAAASAHAPTPTPSVSVEAVGAPAAEAVEEAAVPGATEPLGAEELGEDPAAEPKRARIKLRLKGLSGGRLDAGERFKVYATLRPFAKGERITLILRRGKRTVKRVTRFAKRTKRGAAFGRVSFAKRPLRSGRYSVQAVKKPSVRLTGAKDRTRAFKIRYPDLDPGQRNSRVRLLNQLLRKQGYATAKGKSYGGATQRAILAFRKVNKMARTTDATGSIFKRLANGKGGYKVRAPDSGKHVEIDISRQVMALVDGSKVHRTYHVSTGASATPTIPGTWRFYRKEPGFNNVDMYYSVYYDRGYATHGYKSVPTYPASHGCTRNPIPDSKYIYDWISIGDLVHVYR